MANITGLITVNSKQILEVDADPSTGLGAAASVGSLALFDDNGSAVIYIKSGSADTAWSAVSTVTTEEIQDAVGTILSNTANIDLTYDDSGNQISADLTNTSVAAGSYGASDSVSTFTVDAKGRLTSASSVSIDIVASQVSDFSSAADARISLQKGVANGIVPLDGNALIPSQYLPSYVDDVIEYANLAAFPATGSNGVIYVALDTNKTYRWSGSIYIEISPSEVTSVFGRSGAVTAQSGDYSASQITNTPSGSISATTVQAAIDELDAEKQPIDATLTALAAFNSNGILVQTAQDTFVSRNITNGTGITVTNGNGVAANPSIAISDTGVTAGSYGSASQVASISVNAQGQITSASNTSIAIASTQVTDFNEAAQDAVGAMVSTTASVALSYNDASNQLVAVVVQSGIDHGSISGLLDDDHSQYALLAGRSGGQSLTGGTAASNNLSLSSTSSATKGKINLGSSVAVDEANTRLGVGSSSPESLLHLQENNVKFNVSANSTTTAGAVNAVVTSISTTNNSVELVKIMVTGFRTNGANESVAYERTLRIKNSAGTVSLPTIQSDYTSEDPALSSANVTPIVNGSSVDIRVTGVASCDITWKVVINRMR
ncbi:hypothetical protein EBZ38_05950 [bacterium]|nr:hypothetical protein [bacterium]